MDDSRDPGAPDSLPVGERIRRRREELGLAAKDLAARVGISASYLSLIERQGRVPSPEVAEALAHELGDDVDLYLAWAGSKDYDDLGTHLRRLTRLRHFTTDPAARRRVVSGEDLDEAAADADAEGPEPWPRAESPTVRSPIKPFRDERPVVHESMPVFQLMDHDLPERLERLSLADVSVRRTPEGPVTLVPVYANGADPAADPAPLEVLEIDRRLLPPGADDCFAYRPDVRASRRVRDQIRPGDLVVLSRRPGSLDARSIHAVRHRGRVVLTRATVKSGGLAMLPSPGDPSSFEWLPLDDADGPLERAVARAVAGTVVATLRWWSGG